MGVAKAAEDSVALADSIKAHGASTQALSFYALQRQPAGLSAVLRARWLGGYVKAAGQHHPMEIRQHLAIQETAIDWGRYGRHSAFKECFQ
jgi:hypothetical protein